LAIVLKTDEVEDEEGSVIDKLIWRLTEILSN